MTEVTFEEPAPHSPEVLRHCRDWLAQRPGKTINDLLDVTTDEQDHAAITRLRDDETAVAALMETVEHRRLVASGASMANAAANPQEAVVAVQTTFGEPVAEQLFARQPVVPHGDLPQVGRLGGGEVAVFVSDETAKALGTALSNSRRPDLTILRDKLNRMFDERRIRFRADARAKAPGAQLTDEYLDDLYDLARTAPDVAREA